MKIIIPTMQRADIQFTARQLMTGDVQKKYECFLVIPADEDHNKYYEFTSKGFKIILTQEKGISNVRQFIMEKCKVDDNKIVMMDDDLRFFERPDLDDVALFMATGEQILDMVDWLCMKLEDYAHCSIPARTQNFQLTSRMQRTEGFCLETVRPYRIYGYRKDIVLGEGLKFGAGLDVNTMDDFHMTLELLELGYRNIINCQYAHDQYTSNSRGGASCYRDLELLKKCALNLKEKHPKVVEIVQKITRSSWGGTNTNPVTRTDVRIAWQKSLGIRLNESKI